MPSATKFHLRVQVLLLCATLLPPYYSILALSSPTTTIRVCSGSSCLSKCRGGFDPVKSFESLQKQSEENSTIEIEETFCMNQCKRGPNARIMKDAQVLTIEGEMNETEMKRKSFQGVTSDKRVEHLWGLAKGLEDGTVDGIASGSVDKLTDIMPQSD